MKVRINKEWEKLIKENYKKYIKNIYKWYKLIILTKSRLIKY